MKRPAALGCLAGLALLAGCASQPSAAPTRTAYPPVRPVPVLTPAAYVAEAGSIDLLAIRAGELAQSRSASARVRQLAAESIALHKGMAGQLSLAGRRLNLLPAASLLPRHQAMLASLSASQEFDRAYLDALADLNDEAIRLHGDYARRGASPTLRPVASAALARVQSERALVRR